MAAFLWVGTSLGVVLGALHTGLVFRQQKATVGRGFGMAAYFSLWTMALWILFGAYVLGFYLLGAAAMLASRLFQKVVP